MHVPPLFRADSGTNLNKEGENVKGQPSGLVAQLVECSHSDKRGMGFESQSGHKCFLPCDIHLTLKVPIRIAADDSLEYFFNVFLEKLRLVISFESFARQRGFTTSSLFSLKE